MANGNFRLGVYIADVSHYVQNGNAIDVDAYDRATSVYFPRRVIPMLPEKLSNGLCSLNPKVDRLCLVCDMLITADGDLHAYQFYPAVMNSHARLTYTEVAAILSNTRGPEAAQRADLVPHLLDLHGVYSALLKAREARGAVDFDTVETKIVSDEAGRIEKIVPSQRTLAHRLIEECMLAANVSAGDFILHNQRLALFRVHEKPSIEKIEILRAYLKALAIPASISDHPTAAEFQAIAKATHDRPDALQVHTMLLRSMMQAMYTPENIGHFGLAYEAYTHFTSPIRRYPDLLLHRVIKAILADKPSLRLEIQGRADLEGARRARLEDKIQARWQDRGGEPDSQPDAVARAAIIKSLYEDGSFKKPRNLIGIAKTLPTGEMEALLLANQAVVPREVPQIAHARALEVKRYLEDNAALDPARLFIVAAGDSTTGNGVAFSLK